MDSQPRRSGSRAPCPAARMGRPPPPSGGCGSPLELNPRGRPRPSPLPPRGAPESAAEHVDREHGDSVWALQEDVGPFLLGAHKQRPGRDERSFPTWTLPRLPSPFRLFCHWCGCPYALGAWIGPRTRYPPRRRFPRGSAPHERVARPLRSARRGHTWTCLGSAPGRVPECHSPEHHGRGRYPDTC